MSLEAFVLLASAMEKKAILISTRQVHAFVRLGKGPTASEDDHTC